MDEVNELYRRLLQYKSDVDSSIGTFESSSDPPSVSIQQRTSWLLNEFEKGIDHLRIKIRTLDPRTRIVWDTRIARFAEDAKVMRSACERRLGAFFRTLKEEENREYLFSGPPAGVSSVLQNQLLTESNSLKSSHSMMDSITEQSRVILGGLLGQNATLKNARGKLYDLINNATVSQSMSNSISSRERVDAIIVYGCMAFTLVVFLLLWWLVR